VSDTTHINLLVDPKTKARILDAARRELLNPSVWLRRLIDAGLASDRASSSAVGPSFVDGRSARRKEAAKGARLSIRQRPDDRLLLRERAAARGMAPATYASVFLRAHLRDLAPLPKAELLALEAAIEELAAVGRNLNQIAKAANSGARTAGPSREELRTIVKVCEAMRDHTKSLLKANLISWNRGHAEDQD
jgi:hypothetical protein